MTTIEFPCSHVPTDAERRRDPIYIGCMADAGEPCVWATRHDGITDPQFHSERFEAANAGDGTAPQQTKEQFEADVLATGLV